MTVAGCWSSSLPIRDQRLSTPCDNCHEPRAAHHGGRWALGRDGKRSIDRPEDRETEAAEKARRRASIERTRDALLLGPKADLRDLDEKWRRVWSLSRRTWPAPDLAALRSATSTRDRAAAACQLREYAMAPHNQRAGEGDKTVADLLVFAADALDLGVPGLIALRFHALETLADLERPTT